MSSPPAAERVEIAVLDRAGVIVSVNAAWNSFCTANDGDPAACGPGTSYLAVCRAGGDRTSLQLAAALSAMLSGERATAITITIPCDGTEGERWFDVSASPRLDDQGRVVGATVMLWVVERPPAPLSTTRRLAMVPDQEAVWDLIEAFPDGTVLVDDAGIISHANRQLERLTGRDRSDLVGAPIEVLLPAQLRARHSAWAQGYRDAPRVRAMGADAELTLRCTDGRELPVEISLAPVHVGAQEMTMASVHDVSAQRASERSRQQLQQRTALVARITSLVLSDADPNLVYDEVTTGTEHLLVLQGQPSHHPHPYAGAHDDALDTPSAPPGVREWTVAAAIERAVRAVGGRLSDDETAMLTDLESQLRLVLELGIARSDRERLEMLEDRQRIGRDLHDTVIQALIGIGLQLAMSSGDADGVWTRRDNALVEQLDAAIMRMRLVVFDTRETGKDVDLADAVRRVLSGAARTLGHQPVLVLDGDLARLSPEVGNHLIPVLREALSNVARHARATSTRVTLTVGPDDVVLVVDDDGRGIVVDVDPAGGGTTNFRERAAMLSGRSSLRARPEGGTRLEWTVPVTTKRAANG